MATNTEKPTGKAEQKKNIPTAAPKVDKKAMEKSPVQQKPAEEVSGIKSQDSPVSTQSDERKKVEEVKTSETKTESQEKKPAEEKKKQPSKKVKKEEVSVNAKSVPVSTKYAIAICKFVKKKRIGDAIRDLEQVAVLKKAVPMKGEIPHRKGAIMSGRFPQRAAKEFIVLLKSLAGNATNHDIDEPVITEAIANKAQRPFGRFGRWQRKRTHITLRARNKFSLSKPSKSQLKAKELKIKSKQNKKSKESKK